MTDTSFTPKFDTLVDVFDSATARYRDRPLFGEKRNGTWNWMTFAEFARDVADVRGGFAALGVNEKDRVGIIANNRSEWAIAAYATYGRNAAYVPMYESQHLKEWAYILRDCGAKLVIVANDKARDAILAAKAGTDDEGKGLPDLQHIVVLGGTSNIASSTPPADKDIAITWDELKKLGRDKPVASLRPTSADIAGFIYTSGTTGNPKGVKLTHKNIACNVSAMHEVFPMSTEDRSLSFLPWAHSFGQSVELHGLLSMGASMAIAESVDKIIANLSEVHPTLLFSVPRIFNRIYDGVNKKVEADSPLRRRIFRAAVANAALRKRLAEKKRSSGFADLKQKVFDRVVFQKIRDQFGGKLRYAFSGGAAISKEVAEFIDNLGITVYEGYGLTETSPIATANWPGARKIGSVGKPIPGVRIEIDRTETNDPKNGEIVVFGHNVMLGYHGHEEENSKVFTPDGGFRTGDMGYLDEDGFLYITGRIKEQYKLENGKYVVPSPLEDQLKLSPFIANSFVFGDNKLYNVALVVPDMGALKKWAEQHGLSGEPATWLDNEKVNALYREEVDKHSANFKQFEKIKKLKLIPEDFTVENGMLTPKLSLKRRVVLAKYQGELDKLY